MCGAGGAAGELSACTLFFADLKLSFLENDSAGGFGLGDEVEASQNSLVWPAIPGEWAAGRPKTSGSSIFGDEVSFVVHLEGKTS